MKLFSLSIIISLSVLNACCSAKSYGNQGINGVVVRVSGNQMPSPDDNINKMLSKDGIQTIVYIFEVTNISQVNQQNGAPFFTNITSKFIKEVPTNNNGTFKVTLPAGTYSLFTKKGTLYYANWFDEKNNIFPVEVVAGVYTDVEVKVDFDATY